MHLKKWTLAWKIRLIQEKNPKVDHCDAQWIPAFARMTGTHNCVVIDLSLSFPRRRESIKARPEQVFLRYFGFFLFHFGLEICKVIRLVSPKTCKFSTNDSAIFPYRSIRYCFIQSEQNNSHFENLRHRTEHKQDGIGS